MNDGTQLFLAELAEQARQRLLTDSEALEELVVDNQELERLEALLDEFNIFEAIGMVSQEIRHSAFLAFLLDPRQSHGLGDVVLKRVLQKTLTAARGMPLPISRIDLDVWDLTFSQVQREWENIDILVLTPVHKLAVIIENKILSDEHSDQLNRYWDIVKKQHPGWRVLGVFLTSDGRQPSEVRPDVLYLPLSYTTVTEVLERLMVSRASVLGTDVHSLIVHYTQMLRRYIVSDSEIDRLCQQIYQRHKRALDLIFERRPDRQADIRRSLSLMIEQTPGFVMGGISKQWVGFLPSQWDIPGLIGQAHAYSKDGHLLMLFFENKFTKNVSEGIRLILQICPGDAHKQHLLLGMAATHPQIFKSQPTVKQGWYTLYTRNVLTSKDVEQLDTVGLEAQLSMFWKEFRQDELPGILEAFPSDALMAL